jgi:hypothetical protein
MNELSMFNELDEDVTDMKSLLRIRAAELFKLCDKEDKGFINKRDIQRMKDPLGLSPDLLEEVFESLDVDGDNYLTLDEFTAGFSNYLGTSFDEHEETASTKHLTADFDNNQQQQQQQQQQHQYEKNYDQEGEESLFRETMESLGATSIIEGYTFLILSSSFINF